MAEGSSPPNQNPGSATACTVQAVNCIYGPPVFQVKGKMQFSV